jgi:hypothetical protein
LYARKRKKFISKEEKEKLTKRRIQNSIPNQWATRIIQNHERNVAANMASARTRGVIKNRYQNLSKSIIKKKEILIYKSYPLHDCTPPRN